MVQAELSGKSLLMLWMLYFDGSQECYGLSVDDFLAAVFRLSNHTYVATDSAQHATRMIHTSYSSVIVSWTGLVSKRYMHCQIPINCLQP